MIEQGWTKESRHDPKGEILIRKTVVITGMLALILGFFMGTAIPQEKLFWKTEEVPQPNVSTVSVISAASPAEAVQADISEGEKQMQSVQEILSSFNPKENFPLLNTACSVLRVIQNRNYKALSAYVDPVQGLTFTTFSTVDRGVDLTFTRSQVAGFAKDISKYTWGVVPGSGEVLSMTPEEYFNSYVFNVDYTQATRIGVDRLNITGNALENVAEAYPTCRFVEFTYPGSGQGQDWCSLKLVFSHDQSMWMLVGIIHGQWTV